MLFAAAVLLVLLAWGAMPRRWPAARPLEGDAAPTYTAALQSISDFPLDEMRGKPPWYLSVSRDEWSPMLRASVEPDRGVLEILQRAKFCDAWDFVQGRKLDADLQFTQGQAVIKLNFYLRARATVLEDAGDDIGVIEHFFAAKRLILHVLRNQTAVTSLLVLPLEHQVNIGTRYAPYRAAKRREKYLAELLDIERHRPSIADILAREKKIILNTTPAVLHEMAGKEVATKHVLLTLPAQLLAKARSEGPVEDRPWARACIRHVEQRLGRLIDAARHGSFQELAAAFQQQHDEFRETTHRDQIQDRTARALLDPDPHKAEELLAEFAGGMILATFAFPLERLALLESYASAESRAILCELALDAYREEHKAVPDDLSQLVPRYLPHAPLDPFGTGPLKLLRSFPDGYWLYSVGPDGEDDRLEKYIRPTAVDELTSKYKGDVVLGQG